MAKRVINKVTKAKQVPATKGSPIMPMKTTAKKMGIPPTTEGFGAGTSIPTKLKNVKGR